MDTRIVDETLRFVKWLYTRFLPAGYRDFQWDLSLEFKNNSLVAGRRANFNDQELEVLAISALLYNAGCIEGQYYDRAVSKTIARSFLEEQHLPENKIYQVLGCIDATQSSFNARNKMEELIQWVQKATPRMTFSTWD